MEKYWLTIVIVALIIASALDGIRRMRRARQDSLKMSLRPPSAENPLHSGENDYGSEFPNGGARVSGHQIDPERIKQARNKYNFGGDIPAWGEKIAEKIADSTLKSEPDNRVEPSVDIADDTLLDDVSPPSEDYNEMEPPYSAAAEEQQGYDGFTEELSAKITPDKEQHSATEGHSVDESGGVTKPSTPVQTSLNLDDSVPMLMDTFNEADVLDKNHISNEKSVYNDKDISVYNDNSVTEYEDESDVAVAERTEVTQTPIVSVGTHIESRHSEAETYSANKPRYESKYTDHSRQLPASPSDDLVIHVKAAQDQQFYGSDLLEFILDNGLRFGAMGIFHRHLGEDGEGPVLFSMANMVKPGTFDLHTFEDFSTIGLSFFLALPTVNGEHLQAFETMLSTAQNLAEKLSGELKDEQRSVLTRQTIEHYRERIRDFSRKEKLEKNK